MSCNIISTTIESSGELMGVPNLRADYKLISSNTVLFFTNVPKESVVKYYITVL